MQLADQPVVDTHLHIWDPGNLACPWLKEVPSLNRPHLPSDYDKATADLNVIKMIFVQAEVTPALFLEEAQWVAEQAVREPRILGLVPWAPLEKGEEAREDLEALCRVPNVKGIRRIIQFEQDIEFCLRPDFVRGVRLLADLDLTFDICIDHTQLANTIKLVRQCPDVMCILDHIGKPDIKHQVMEPWKKEIRELAGLPNTFCKMSGLVNEADWEAWQPQDLRPYIDHVIDCFGWDRVAFGGDWPVCLLASPYQRWIETLWDALQGASQDELNRLFVVNAETFYRV